MAEKENADSPDSLPREDEVTLDNEVYVVALDDGSDSDSTSGSADLEPHE